MTKLNIYRSKSDRMIAGVCGGLAEFLEIDALIVRLIFVLIALAGGSSLLIYIILWILLPTKSQKKDTLEETIKQNAKEIKTMAEKTGKKIKDHLKEDDEGLCPIKGGKPFAGILVLWIGIIFLLKNFNMLDWFEWGKFWPVILIVVGLFMIFKKKN